MIGQLLGLTLPVSLAGLTHVVAIKLGVLPRLARVPLDGGRSWRGTRILGDNKTLRGVVVMTVASMFWVSICDRLIAAEYRYLRPEQLSSLGYGFALGAGYLLGELPNSFVKRRFRVSPGGLHQGRTRLVFWVGDQVDSALGILLVLLPWRVPEPAFVLGLLVIAVLLHPVVAALMVVLGLKGRIG